MSHPIRIVFALALLFLVGCDSSTDPAGGGGRFDLSDAFDDDVAEFEESDTGGRLRFDGIDFGDRDSSTLTDADKTILDGFAAVFEGVPGATYRIESHTDERGADSYNLGLTRSRAEAVAAYLTDVVGGPGPYIEAVGLGESVPLDEASNAVAWARNDRVEIVVAEDDVPVRRFVLTATRLDAIQDCDTNPSPDELQPGDFWITVSIRVSNRDGFFVMDEIVDEPVKANDGETLELDIAASAAIRAIETDIVEIFVEFEEHDGGSFFDFGRSQLFQLGYIPALDCWGPWGGSDACGLTDAGIITVEDASVPGSSCETSLEWTLRVETVR